MRSRPARKRSARLKVSLLVVAGAIILSAVPLTEAGNHMNTIVVPLRKEGNDSNDIPLVVTNNCMEDLYPAVWTQGGSGPKDSGFPLNPGATKNLTVSPDWQGRVWARTNCTFNDDGTGPANKSAGPSACGTGDCGGVVNCTLTVCVCPALYGKLLIFGQKGRSTGHACRVYNVWSEQPVVLRHLSG
jgi:hypothetical protein